MKRWWARFWQFWNDITTARDNQTADIVRVMGLAAGVQFIWKAGWASFEPVSYATGAGLIIAAVAGAMRVARPTEPEA